MWKCCVLCLEYPFELWSMSTKVPRKYARCTRMPRNNWMQQGRKWRKMSWMSHYCLRGGTNSLWDSTTLGGMLAERRWRRGNTMESFFQISCCICRIKYLQKVCLTHPRFTQRALSMNHFQNLKLSSSRTVGSYGKSITTTITNQVKIFKNAWLK